MAQPATASSTLSTIEHFLLISTDKAFTLYVRHCRLLLSHPPYRDQHENLHKPKSNPFLGLPTGPNTNQWFATGDRCFVRAAVRQRRCDQEAARDERITGMMKKMEGGSGGEEGRFPGGNGGKCAVM